MFHLHHFKPPKSYPACVPSTSAATEDDRLNGLEQNRRVEREALVLDVVEIVLQLLPRVFNRSAVRIFNLRPARQAGSDQVPLLVERNLLGELRDEVRALGAWA